MGSLDIGPPESCMRMQVIFLGSRTLVYRPKTSFFDVGRPLDPLESLNMSKRPRKPYFKHISTTLCLQIQTLARESGLLT